MFHLVAPGLYGSLVVQICLKPPRPLSEHQEKITPQEKVTPQEKTSPEKDDTSRMGTCSNIFFVECLLLGYHFSYAGIYDTTVFVLGGTTRPCFYERDRLCRRSFFSF